MSRDMLVWVFLKCKPNHVFYDFHVDAASTLTNQSRVPSFYWCQHADLPPVYLVYISMCCSQRKYLCGCIWETHTCTNCIAFDAVYMLCVLYSPNEETVLDVYWRYSSRFNARPTGSRGCILAV